VLELHYSLASKIGICIAATYLGMYLPGLFIKNKIQKRQLSIKRAFPDALDLLLICVESGMSIEAALRKVAQEIGSQSIPLAEELTRPTPNCPICRTAARLTKTLPSAPTWRA